MAKVSQDNFINGVNPRPLDYCTGVQPNELSGPMLAVFQCCQYLCSDGVL